MHQNSENKFPISAHADASCTMLMGVWLGHVSANLDDPGQYYSRGKTGPNADFSKIGYPKNSPAKRAPAAQPLKGTGKHVLSYNRHRMFYTRSARHN